MNYKRNSQAAKKINKKNKRKLSSSLFAFCVYAFLIHVCVCVCVYTTNYVSFILWLLFLFFFLIFLLRGGKKKTRQTFIVRAIIQTPRSTRTFIRITILIKMKPFSFLGGAGGETWKFSRKGRRRCGGRPGALALNGNCVFSKLLTFSLVCFFPSSASPPPRPPGVSYCRISIPSNENGENGKEILKVIFRGANGSLGRADVISRAPLLLPTDAQIIL